MEKRLVAYYTTSAEESPDIETLRAHLQRRLPGYMVPAAYVHLPALPLTPNGKLDRKALPEPPEGAYPHREYEAPSGPVESALAQIWQELLQVQRVGRHDNFFELGGHSLLAVRLQDQLAVRGYTASLTSLFKYPTLTELARSMTDVPHPRTRVENLVVLREAGAQTPLFLIHEAGGDVACLVPLAERLDSEIPVYGLELTSTHHVQSIEGLAAQHLRSIREIQPKGPYRIAGYSLGGVVAYEMAAQLLGVDETVTFLGLIDTYSPDATRRVNASRNAATQKNAQPTLARRRDPRDNPAFVEKLKKIAAACIAAQDDYRIEPISVPISLFRPQPIDGMEDSSTGWRQPVNGNLESYIVGGDHSTMINEPHVDQLAEVMSTVLRRSGA